MNFTLLNLIILLYLGYLALNLKRYLHMLQLNSYMNHRYVNWYKRNLFNELSIKMILPLFSIPFLIMGKYLLFTIVWVIAYTSLLLLRRKTYQEKKKFVVTARIKRLIVTNIIIYLLIILIGNYIFTYSGNGLAFCLILLIIFGEIKITYILIANGLNYPIEKLINWYYYNDAKKIMERNKNLIVIGITGSYGKTSSKFILSRILEMKYNVLMTPESFNTLMGVVRTIREKLKPIHEVFVAEMGARRSGDIKEICQLVKPRYALITSIGYQHLETFKSIENIISTKYELVNSLDENGIAFLNFDNSFIKDRKSNGKYISYGINNPELDYWAENIRYDSKGASFTLCNNKSINIELRTRLLGRHNVLNIITACAISLELGVSIRDISLAVKQIPPVPHRLELKDSNKDIIIIDDAYNSNPEGASEALNVLASFTSPRKILITPGMVELGSRENEFNFEFGKKAAQCADYIILVGKKRTEPIYEGVCSSHFEQDKVFVVKNLNEALLKMKEIAIVGSVVLFENDLTDDYEE